MWSAWSSTPGRPGRVPPGRDAGRAPPAVVDALVTWARAGSDLRPDLLRRGYGQPPSRSIPLSGGMPISAAWNLPPVPARLIGAIFVERGLVTQEALDEALAQPGPDGPACSARSWWPASASRGSSWRVRSPSSGRSSSAAAKLDPGSRDDERHSLGNRRRRRSDPLFESRRAETARRDLRRAGNDHRGRAGGYALRRQSETGERLGEILVAQRRRSRGSARKRSRRPVGEPAEVAPARAGAWQRAPAPGPATSPRLPGRSARPRPSGWTRWRRDSQSLKNETDRHFATSCPLGWTRWLRRSPPQRPNLQETLAGVDEARAEGARRLGELAGEMPPLAAEVEGLRRRTEQLEGRSDEDLRSGLKELGERVAEIADRPSSRSGAGGRPRRAVGVG